MGTSNFGKLVRDKVPEIIERDGSKPVVRILENEEYLDVLVEKLAEECREFKETLTLEELADIQEVIGALARAIGADRQELEKVRADKAAKRGGFNNRVFLENVKRR